MAKLIDASNMSLDGCTEDERGAFDWAPPDDEVFAFITDLMGSAVDDLKAAARRDLLVGGPNLAAQAFKAGLVDECQLFVWPVVLGGGKPALSTDTRADLALLDERRFSNGVVHLRDRPL
jgi:dihydrofolate reductase